MLHEDSVNSDISARRVPGEFLYAADPIEINPGADRIELDVVNTGDRPVQVGSHVHFPQANAALEFDRAAARGRRLDIPAGTAVRFEPGLGQRVSLIPLRGAREVHGISLDAPGKLDA
ncbi:urease subunit beta [Nocardia terpenica]|uniref:Urease subunit beta n=1 Tax=Nocardia terpenica TaxID=455432 RepID=A0A291RJ09_9NOCA|nr:urease subunit beta [Nocardia terpenica]ATL67601.1 urease subunit beta [Nocardia terpenica]